MSIQDYVNNNIIGVNNVEVDCTKWEFMKQVSDSSWEAFKTTFHAALNSSAAMLDYNTLSERQGLDLLLYRFNNAVRAYDVTRKIFYNSLICTPLDIVDSTTVPNYYSELRTDGDFAEVQNVLITRTDISVPVDYTGKTTFTEQYYTDFQAAQVEMSETQKDLLKLFCKATEASLTTPATPFNGTC